MIRSVTFKLYPTEDQKKILASVLDACRWVYNNALEYKIKQYKKHRKNVSYVDAANKLPYLKAKHPFLQVSPSQSLQQSLKKLDLAFSNFFRRVKDGNEKSGFPRFKSANRFYSFTYPQPGSGSVQFNANRVQLSRIGSIKFSNHQQILGKIRQVHVRRKSGNWYLIVVQEFPDEIRIHPSTKSIGLDLGLTHLAVLSNGMIIDNPRPLRHHAKELKRLQQDVFRKQKDSNRRKKAVFLLQKKHLQVSNCRKDHSHKFSRWLVDKYRYVFMEDLKPSNMLKNHHLAKSISDASWGMIKRFTHYKAEEAGSELILVNPRNTSKRCYNCGKLHKKLTLSVRVFKCKKCGWKIDRDFNAALNIKRSGLDLRGEEVRPVRHSSVKREAV